MLPDDAKRPQIERALRPFPQRRGYHAEAFDAVDIPCLSLCLLYTSKTWWRRPAVAVAASLFLVLAAGLTLLYPVLMPPASSTLEERVELSFKARADILGAPDYGLEGNRSESLRLIESYTEFQKVLARIGLQTAGETRVSTEVPYPREIEAELPYNETYFEKHVLLMLLYPWETGYAAEDVTGAVSYTHLKIRCTGGWFAGVKP